MRPLPLGDAATTIGGYELVLELSSDETTVLLARRTGPRSFSRWVTIRYVGPFDPADRARLDRIDLDLERAASIRHPCVLPILESGALANGRYVVGDYVEGGTLADLIAQGRLPPAVAVTLIADVIAGLDAVVRAEDGAGRRIGLVHGRVCPSSVVVGLDGRARVADLGLSRVRAVTASNGKPFLYQAPEVLRGERASERSDVFSVGMILYEMLAGGHPYARASSERDAERALEQPLPILSAARPSVGAPLAEVVARAVALDPDQRFRTFEALSGALERACAAAPLRETSAFITERLGPRVEARRELSRKWVVAHAAAIGEPSPSRIARARRRARIAIRRRRRELWALAIAGVIALWALLGALILRSPR